MAIEVTTDLNLVDTSQIVDGSVTSAKIADNAVVAAKIAAGAVGSASLTDNAVVAAKIAAGAVGSAALASGAVVAASIAAGAVGSAALADNAVVAAKIAAGSVGTAAISSGAATTGQILQANGSGGASFTAAPAAGLTPSSFYQYTGASGTALTNFLTKTGTAGTQNRPGANSIHFTKFVPLQDFTVSNLALVCSDVGSGFAYQTLVRFGIYTRSGSTFTLVARTASDTSIFAASNTKYTRALNTTGGYPATYAMTAGSEYWIALTMQFSTGNGCSAVCTPSAVSGFNDVYTASGADLTATATGTASAVQAVFWEVS